MNPRERFLAIGLGAVVGMFGLWYLFGWYQGKLTARQAELDGVKSKVQANERIIAQGQRAAKKLATYEMQSLPSNIERSQSLYQKWLLDLVQKHQITDSNVTAVSGRTHKDVFHQYTFSIKGRANLPRVTRLLHDFYSVDRLHRIRRLRIKPVQDSTDLDLDIVVEALSLRSAPDANELKKAPSQRLAHGDVEAYVKTIAERNIFGPPHQPPQVQNTARREYPLGSIVTFSVKGTDPEKRPVNYALDQSNFSGGELDPKLGTFVWKPTEKGTYEMTVRVTDGGVPAKSVTQTIKFAVVDPPPEKVVEAPPPKPKFDDAKYTYLTAVLDVGGQPEAWLVVRTTGKTLKLQPGEKFDIGTLQGTILEITEQEIEIETAEGERMLISVGENLREGLTQPAAEAL